MTRLAIAMLLLSLATSVEADGISGGFGDGIQPNGIGSPDGITFNKIASGPPPTTCGTGVIDLSTGCTLGIVP